MADRKFTPAPAAPAVGGIEDLVEAERDRIMDAMSVLALARKATAPEDAPDLWRAIRTAEGLLDRTCDALDSVCVKAATRVSVEAAAEVAA
jgi:hypothetical protein